VTPQRRTRSRARAIAAGLALRLLALAPHANAEPKSSAASAETPEAIYEKGQRAFDQGRFDEAADDFAQSFEAVPQTRCLWNLALAEYRAHRTIPALHHFQAYLLDGDATPTNIERARRLVVELEAKVCRLTLLTEHGAMIQVDGLDRGLAPLPEPFDLDPGSPHTVIVHLGDREARRDIAPPGPGAISIALPLPTPAPPVALDASRATVATAPTPERPVPQERRTNTARLVVSASLAGAAVIATGVAVYLGIQSDNEHSAVDTYHQEIPMGACPGYAHCADLSNAIDANRRDVFMSYGFYAAAGVLAAGALAAFVLMPSSVREPRSQSRLVPVVDPIGRGIGIVGSF
jgi:hypothetical protein